MGSEEKDEEKCCAEHQSRLPLSFERDLQECGRELSLDDKSRSSQYLCGTVGASRVCAPQEPTNQFVSPTPSSSRFPEAVGDCTCNNDVRADFDGQLGCKQGYGVERKNTYPDDNENTRKLQLSAQSHLHKNEKLGYLRDRD